MGAPSLQLRRRRGLRELLHRRKHGRLWDEREGRYYVSSTQNYGSSAPFSFDVTAGTWRWESGAFIGGYGAFFKGSTRDQRTWVLTLYGTDYAGAKSSRPYTLRRIDMDTQHVTDVAVTLGSSFKEADFPGGDSGGPYFDGQGVAFIPPLNRYVVNVMTTGGMRWATIDGATGVLDRLELPGRLPPTANTLVETKVIYLPRLDVLLWVESAEHNVRALRLAR